MIAQPRACTCVRNLALALSTHALNLKLNLR